LRLLIAAGGNTHPRANGFNGTSKTPTVVERHFANTQTTKP
jgi:hypothetical protein